MPVLFDAVGPSSAGTNATGTSLSWSHTCSGSDRLLTASVAVGSGTGATTTTATYNGVSMTSAAKVYSNNATDGYVELFYLVAPATGANNVVITCNLSKSLVGGSTSFTGVDQSTPVSNITTNFGSSAAPTVTVTSDYGNMVVDALCNGSNINSSNHDMQWRKNANTLSAAGNGAQATAYGTRSVTMTYSVSNDWWGIAAMNINATPITAHPLLISTTTPAAYTTNTTPRNTSITTLPGDLVVIYAGGEESTDTINTPSGNGISFTLKQSVVVLNYSTAYLWSGVDSTGGTWTLSVSYNGANKWGYTCFVFRNSAGIGATAAANSTGAPALNLTTLNANSGIVVFTDDANAVNGASRTWQTVNGITPSATNSMEIDYAQSFSTYTIYGAYYYDAGAAGNQTLGVTAPTGQQYSIIAAEVYGSAAPPTNIAVAWFSA